MNLMILNHPALPEILLLSGMVIILLIDLFLKGNKPLTFWLVELLLLAVLYTIIMNKNGEVQLAFAGQYVADRFALLVKGFCVALTFLIFAYTRPRNEFQGLKSEYLFLILLSLLGAMVLASSASLITLYLGLELLSLPVYALIALKRDSAKSSEAAIKYFVMGALASGFLLYGFSLLYGLTGSLWLPQIASVLLNGQMSTSAFWVLVMMILALVAFKLGVVPFHMWIPDVYDGAPISATIFISSVPKIAIVALFMRLFAESMTPATLGIQPVFFVLGAISLLWGATAALLQKNIRRFLGYSTIANMGIAFIALGVGSLQGFANGFLYVVVYALTSVAFFGLILMFNRELILIEDLKGLHHSKPFTAFLFLVVLLSFAGIPPLLGFDAKLMVLMSLIHSNHVGMAILMLVLSVISAGYVLKMVKTIYFDRGDGEFSIKPSLGTLCVTINTLAILGFGIFPIALLNVVNHAFM